MANKLLCLLLFGGIYVCLWCGEVACNKTDLEHPIFDNSMLSEIEEVHKAENGSTPVLDYKEGIWPNSSENGDYRSLSDAIPPETILDSTLHWQALNLSATCLETARRLNLLTKTKSDCGGILVNSIGGIYTDSALKGCKWLVCNDYGMYVRIKVSQWIENCDKYFLNVCDGCQFSKNGSQLEKGTRHEFCGVPPESVFLSSNPLIVIEVKLPGWFSALYQFLKRKPDCLLTSHDGSGTITSPEYPNSYPNDMSCKWKINAPAEYRIVLTIMDFRMDCGTYDAFLQIWDGTYEEYPMITSYSKESPPPPTLTLNSNSVTISSHIRYCFVNDIFRFKLSWRFIPSGCNETLRVSSGVITFSRFSNSDMSRLFCNWRIIVNPGSIIRLVFIDFWAALSLLSCDKDYVEIADIDTNNMTSKTRYCYDRDPPGPIYTTGNKVGIKLVMSPVLHMDRTFRLRFTAVCTTTVVGYKGIIESINYPYPPPPHLHCMWTINAPNHGSIFINLTHFDGFLKIFEPDGDAGEIGCFIESSEGNKRSCVSRGNKVIVEFKTFSRTYFRPLQIEWKIRGCVKSISSISGNFHSPGYPDLYPFSEVCEWTIVADSGSGIELTIHDWEIENSTDCKFDGLKFYTRSLHVSQLILHLCGTSQYPSVVTAQLSNLVIQFYSDDSLSFKGFNASFKQITTLDSTRNCGQDHFGSTGFMYSPNFPNFYNIWDNCRWTITVQANYLAALKSLEMELDAYLAEYYKDCRGDNLTIYYDKVITGPPKKAFCGKQNATSVVSTSNVLTVTFQTNDYRAFKGFKAMFFQACGAKLIKDRGIIQSPDFHTMMNGAGNCSWTIVPSTAGSRVLLLFTEFYWSVTDPDCGQHFIELLDGNNTSLYRGCCSHLPPVTLSLDNTLTLRTTNAEDLVFKAFFFTVTKDCVHILRAKRVSNMKTSIQNAMTMESEHECLQTLHSTNEGKQTVRVQIKLYQPQVHRNVCRTNFVAVHGKGFSEPPTKYSCLQGIPTTENVFSHYWTVYIILEESNDSGKGMSNGKEGNLNQTNLLLEKNVALSGTAAQSGKLIAVCTLLLYVAMG